MKIEVLQPRSLVHYPRKGVMIATEPRGFDFSNHEETMYCYHRHKVGADPVAPCFMGATFSWRLLLCQYCPAKVVNCSPV